MGIIPQPNKAPLNLMHLCPKVVLTLCR